MVTGLESLFDEFQSAVENGDVETMKTTYEAILETYEQQRDEELQSAIRSRVATVDSQEERKTINEYLGAQRQAFAERVRFKATGGIIVDQYQDLRDNGQFEALWSELQSSISELSSLETTVTETKEASTQVTTGSVPADVDILRADRDTTGALSLNEKFSVTIVIANVGDEQAQNVSLSIDTTDPISANRNSETIGLVNEEESIKLQYEFEITEHREGQIQFILDSLNAGSDQRSITAPVSGSGEDNNIRFDDQEFNKQQFNAVFSDDGNQTQDELSDAINEWFNSEDNSVNNVTLSQDDLSDLINYWFNDL